MANSKRVLVLTGARTGQTCVLAKHQFVGGRTTLVGPELYLEKTTLYLSRAYAAYPEGSSQLEEAMRIGGSSQVHAAPGVAGAPAVPGGFQPGIGRAAQVPPQHGGGDADPAAGGSGAVPPRDGYTDPGLHGGPRRKRAVTTALTMLDPKNDEHWTAEGKPQLATVAAFSGLADLTRAELDAENVKRPQ